MQEDFLHYIWKHKKLDISSIITTEKEVITIVSVGQHNLNSGPDFFNAQLKIGNQLWAGNVEIHVKSSDWFLHNHETDTAYDNVILHVVWEHDTDVFRKDNSEITTLELKNYISKSALNNYEQLFSKSPKWINCENEIASVDSFSIQNWIERLYFERLERKSDDIKKLLETSKNDWEAVLFKMLTKTFGLKVNGDAFLSLANSIDFSIIRKVRTNQVQLESLFLGQSDLLSNDVQDSYLDELKNDYQFLKQKFNLTNQLAVRVQFFRLRPSNFPTIRLSQLANLYNKQQNLFSKVIEATSVKDFYTIFSVETSAFWKSHYTFSKTSRESKKAVTQSFIELLLINTIIPLKFAFAAYQGKQIDKEIVALINEIAPEKNSIIDKFSSLKVNVSSALQSQGLLQLKNDYCNKNKCLQCVIGSSLLNRE